MWLKNNFFKFASRIMAKRPKFDKNSTNEVDCSTGHNTDNLFSRLESPIKSQSDIKEYSVIKLPNGLTALLISDKSQILSIDEIAAHSSDSESSVSSSESSCDEDENELLKENDQSHKRISGCEEKLGACSLCIGVGSFSDPESIQGLAHFLEHMIFMGSEKYPKENEFDVFIKKKGGSDNASTECEYTTFYFDCHEAYLLGAMDIFSHLFISPTMKRESMTKEREAIESEFQMSLPSDNSRKSQLLCSLADESNPAHKFLWGNLITLRDNVKDDELYETVHKFRKHHYSAHRMTLAVQARLPIETLEKWVVECFNDIPSNGLPHDEFILNTPPFKTDKFFKLLIVEPVKNINHLDLTWVLPSTLQMYRKKPLNYLSWVIGHEGKGSLISYLREKLWSFDITVSSGGDGTEENSIYTLFTISLHLTDKGVQNVEDIVNSVFKYISMFQRIGPQERTFKEIQLIAETGFRFAEETSSSDNVEQLSENMQFYPSPDFITGMELYFEFDTQLIKSFLDELRANNVNIMILSKSLASSENLDKIEPWFGTKYKLKEIPSKWIENWQNEPHNSCAYFHLPEQNPFIASDFTILPVPDSKDEFPQNIIEDNLLELWFKQDITFKLPNAFVCLHLVSNVSKKSALNAAMLDLYISVLKQSLAEDLYPANLAQLEYHFHSGEKGIVIIINGYNEKIKVLLEAVINGMLMLTTTMKPDMVLALKDELKKSYSNSNLKTSFLVRDIRMSILLETFWTAVEKEKALNDISYDSLKDFITKYFEFLKIQCLIQGNISKQEAIDLGTLVKNRLLTTPLLASSVPEMRVKQLPQGEKYCVVKSFNVKDSNSVVTNYYQSGLGTIHESCIIELLLMMMEEPIFDSLRTKQQLGYDVSCSLRDTFGILGFSVSVHCQTDRNSVDFVESRITEFLNDFYKTLQETSADDFKEIQGSLIKLKKCADIHLKEEVKRNWDEIKSQEYVFNRHYIERECIEKLTLNELIQWFGITAGVLKSDQFKKLSAQVVGKLPTTIKTNPNQTFEDGQLQSYKSDNEGLLFLTQEEPHEKFIFNINDFKETLALYPVHKLTKRSN